MLNLSIARLIKPVNSVDDYCAGDVLGVDRAEAGRIFLTEIMAAIKTKALSVSQIASITGKSRAAVAARLKSQLENSTVTVENRVTPSGNKPVGFYKLAESVKC